MTFDQKPTRRQPDHLLAPCQKKASIKRGVRQVASQSSPLLHFLTSTPDPAGRSGQGSELFTLFPPSYLNLNPGQTMWRFAFGLDRGWLFLRSPCSSYPFSPSFIQALFTVADPLVADSLNALSPERRPTGRDEGHPTPPPLHTEVWDTRACLLAASLSSPQFCSTRTCRPWRAGAVL